MTTDTVNTFQSMVHTGSLMVFGVILVIMLASIFRPRIFKKLLREFSNRSYILPACAFAGLLMGTVFIATQPRIDNAYVSENTKNPDSTVKQLQAQDTPLSQEIKTEEVTVIEPVAFAKEQQQDASLPAGQTKLAQAGKDGTATRVYSVNQYDGKETSRLLKSETVTNKPTPEITAIGTKTDAPQTDKKVQPKKKADSDKPKKYNLPGF